MSLKVAAQHLSAKGRGPDDTLVHMSRNEVKSLNDLAMAHGGHLTINPQTGLPEAGFLSALLPVIAGAALGPAGFELMTAAEAGMAVGAGSYLLNPKAGIMGALSAGMGAYGGANLGEALAKQGIEQSTQVAEAAKQSEAANQAIRNAAQNSPDTFFKNTADVNAGLTDQGNKLLAAQQAANQGYTTAFNAAKPTDFLGSVKNFGSGIGSLTKEGGISSLTDKLGGGMGVAKTALAVAAPSITQQKDTSVAPVADKDMGQRYTYSPGVAKPIPTPDVPTYEDMLTKQGNFGKQQNYYPNQGYAKVSSDEAKNIYGFAGGGPVERMSNDATTGQNTMYPMANMTTSAFSTPYQSPQSTNMIAPSIAPAGGGTVNMMSGEPNMQGTRLAEGGEANAAPAYTYDAQAQKYISSAPAVPMGAGAGISSAMGMAYNPLTQRFTGGNVPTGQIYLGGGQYGLDEAGRKAEADAAAAAAASTGYSEGPSGDGGGYANGGISDAGYNLGGYSDGGRLLRGPGDGVSDSIPAMIGKKQPARLADGEFVVPARIVSEIGNGSTEAGARKLYGMMDRVQAARRQTVGKGKVARNTRADKYLPA
jgi:hypothetical protein